MISYKQLSTDSVGSNLYSAVYMLANICILTVLFGLFIKKYHRVDTVATSILFTACTVILTNRRQEVPHGHDVASYR